MRGSRLVGVLVLACLIFLLAACGKEQPVHEPVPGQAEWVGEWRLDTSNERDGSTIAIASVEGDELIFELSAFHATNPEGTHANIGDIPPSKAKVTGDTAVFTDGDFQLTMKLKKDKMEVTTSQSTGYFGMGVQVEGTYSKLVITE